MFGLFGKSEKPRFPFATATVTDRGFVRRANEDSFLDRPEDGFFCVSDGMGGGDGGALASRWICDAFAGVMDAEKGSAYGLPGPRVPRRVGVDLDERQSLRRRHGWAGGCGCCSPPVPSRFPVVLALPSAGKRRPLPGPRSLPVPLPATVKSQATRPACLPW